MLSGRCLFILLFASPMSLQNFSHFHFFFTLDCPFGFSTQSLCSFFPFSFFYPFFFFNCPIIHLKIHPEQVNGLSRILAEKKTTALLITKISQGRNSSVQVSTFNQNGLFRYVMWAKVHGFERKDR